ncbi:MAG: glycosyltransferase family 39 protein [Planctomycetes bacterium]|nr:glycosyltransferase family 39 protein [Planctomycetota bacterium]
MNKTQGQFDRLDGTEPGGERPTPYPILLLGILLVITPTVVLSQLAAHWRLDVVDDQMFGYFGWRIAHGATVYLDVWDNKPPGIYWINALGMLIGGDSYAGIVALCVVALIVAHLCFFVVAASIYYRGSAAIATVLASFFLTHAYYQGGTNRTETFLVPCELAAVAFYMRGFARDRWWKWYAAGVCCGAAFLFKQVGLAAWGAMGLHTIILVIARDLPWRTGLRRCLLLLGGTATTLGLAGLYLASEGALSAALFATFGFNRAYFAVGESSFFDNYLSMHQLNWHIMPILRLPILMVIAACIHAGLWWLRPQFRPPEIERPLRTIGAVCPRYMLLFGIWFVAAFYGAMLSPHGFRHYLVPTLPPLMLMAGYLINVLQAEVKLVRRFQQRAWVVAAFVAMGYFALDAFSRHAEQVSKIWLDRQPTRVAGGWQVQLGGWEEVGDEVARLSGPDDKIQCWGYMPGVYLRSRRVNTCRYTTTEKIGQVQQEADFVAQELRDKLSAEPPVVFVISSNDCAWVKGELPKAPSPGWIGEWLGTWIDANYERVADIRNVYIFKRRS